MTLSSPTIGVWPEDRWRVTPQTAMRRRPRSCHRNARQHGNCGSGKPRPLDKACVQWAWRVHCTQTGRQDTKPSKTDRARPYKMPKDEKVEKLSLEEELDADSVFDPLAPSSQSSTAPDSQQESAGPKTPLHFSEGPMTIPPFYLSLLNMPAKDTALSPVPEQDATLLGLAPG